MKDHFRENYFLVLKLIMTLGLVVYITTWTKVLTGAADQVLLLCAFFIAAITGCDFVRDKSKWVLLVIEGLAILLLVHYYEQEFTLLFVILILEIISTLRIGTGYYLLGYLPMLSSSSITIGIWFLITSFLVVIYYQHNAIICSYKKQLKEDEIQEQMLKNNMSQKETSYKKEISKSLLAAENSILEEKSRLSQALHDKLGHSINGSVYQLEACKVLIEKEPKTCTHILQAVIDNLRNSMDEIRELLRKERPDKYQLAKLQLQGLCEECRKMGIETNYEITGKLIDIPDKYLEVILDNAYEAVSNALKYARCTRIEIKIAALNQIVRCSISDNGIGCAEIVDGMGLAGMRKRVRSVNGIIDFESEFGFLINMLLPLDPANRR